MKELHKGLQEKEKSEGVHGEIQKPVINNSMMCQVEEPLPTDLKFIVSNENGGYCLFQSAEEGKIFAVDKSVLQDIYGSGGLKVHIKELTINYWVNKAQHDKIRAEFEANKKQ